MECMKSRERKSLLPLETQSLASSAWYARGVVRDNSNAVKEGINTAGNQYNNNNNSNRDNRKFHPSTGMILLLLAMTPMVALGILYGPPCWEMWKVALGEYDSQVKFWEPQCRDQSTHRHYEVAGLPHPCDHLAIIKGRDVFLTVGRECWDGLPGVVREGLTYGIPAFVLVVAPLWVGIAWWMETSLKVRREWEKYSVKGHIKGGA